MKHTFIVEIDAEDSYKANVVIAERLGYDEDYGFPYSIDWRWNVTHDPLCPCRTPITFQASRAACQCDLIAQVRADQMARCIDAIGAIRNMRNAL